MKGLAVLLAFLLAGGLIVYNLPPQSRCDAPITYKLGNIDPKFNLTKSEVLDSVQKSVNIWNLHYGKNIFEYSPTAGLTIDFVYDERAALDAKIDIQKIQLDKSNASLNDQISKYKTDLAVFQKELSDYNIYVNEKNSSGGVSTAEYDELNNKRDNLRIRAEELNSRAAKLNLVTHDFNLKVQVVNQEVTKFNENIIIKPEEGQYDYSKNLITLYFANNRPELIHTLAHEFGHVIKLNHVNDPLAIMYPYSSGTNSLTPDDKNELAIYCDKQPVYRIWLNEINALFARLM